MNIGQIISLVGHAGLIGWLLFGGAWNSEPLPFDVTDVAVISEADYQAIVAGRNAPAPATDIEFSEPPEEREVAVPDITEEARPIQKLAAEVPELEADSLPQVDQAEPPVVTEVEDVPPEIIPPVDEEIAALVPGASVRPKLKPIERVAPEPVAQPVEADVKPEPEATPDTAPSDEAETPVEQTEAAAPEEATTEINPEAKDDTTLAPAKSVRPRVRPARAAQAQSAATSNAVADALAEALQSEASGEDTPGPSGPPLTGAEKEGLRLAVSRCWNVGALSTEALAVTIVVGVEMQRDGKPVIGSIKLIGHENGSAAAAKQAYEAARRAIIRCGSQGYALPAEKYEQWKTVEIKFNPESMR